MSAVVWRSAGRASCVSSGFLGNVCVDRASHVEQAIASDVLFNSRKAPVIATVEKVRQ